MAARLTCSPSDCIAQRNSLPEVFCARHRASYLVLATGMVFASSVSSEGVTALADVDVEGERADIGSELEEEKGKDSEERPHPVC